MASERKNGSAWTAVVFGADCVTVAEILRPSKGRPRLHSCESFAREGSGVDILKRLKKTKRLTSLTSKHCTTLLDEGQYQLLQMDLPGNTAGLTRTELRESLRWRVKDMVNCAIERAGIDMFEIPAVGKRAPQLWVVVASHDVLQPRIWQFQDAKVKLAAIDIPELAQRNLAGLFEEAHRGLALLFCGYRGGLLTVTFGGELYMTRRIEIDRAGLTEVGADTLYERALLDIQRSLDNFDRNYGAISLSHLLIGPLPGGEAFVTYLRANLSLPVVSADLADVMDFSKTPKLAKPADQANAWLALGAALRE